LKNTFINVHELIYSSKNATRRRLHLTRQKWIFDAIATCHHLTQNPIEISIEYGPGLGVYLSQLAKISSSVYAADIESEYLREIARRKIANNIECIEDDVCSSQFNDRYFDLILCSEVLEHLMATEDALNTLSRTLKHGRYCILTTPQKYSLLELFSKIAFLPGIIQLVRLIYGEPIIEMGHINLKTNKELRIALINAGFEIIEESKFGLYFPILAEFGFDGTLKYFEKFLQRTKFDFLLWTQAFILRKP
jgi:2-polyprenyl-3-methyl-5-hydroxy-6-metoxy-1,4-benzoquinol methylase